MTFLLDLMREWWHFLGRRFTTSGRLGPVTSFRIAWHVAKMQQMRRQLLRENRSLTLIQMVRAVEAPARQANGMEPHKDWKHLN